MFVWNYFLDLSMLYNLVRIHTWVDHFVEYIFYQHHISLFYMILNQRNKTWLCCEFNYIIVIPKQDVQVEPSPIAVAKKYSKSFKSFSVKPTFGPAEQQLSFDIFRWIGSLHFPSMIFTQHTPPKSEMRTK